MTKRTELVRPVLFGASLVLFGCLNKTNNIEQTRRPSSSATKYAPIDSSATAETRNLFFNLKKFAGQGTLFGHHAALIEGRGWKINGESDVKKVSGFYPQVVGFDYRYVHRYPEVYRQVYLDRMREHYERGGIITLSWHMDNPVSGKDFYDKTPAIKAILPSGSHHQVFKSYLDHLAQFLSELRDSRGHYIPVLFRPFHEHNGGWFWWSIDSYFCENLCFLSFMEAHYRQKNDQSFRELWRFTVNYLKRKNIHNLLYVYSPGIIPGKDFFWRYPGNQFVDVFGVDKYVPDLTQIIGDLERLTDDAQRIGKIAALTETGHEGIPNSQYWTRSFLAPIKNSQKARRLAYIMVWRNDSNNEKHFFAPYLGHHSASNFLEIVRDPFLQMNQAQSSDFYKDP